MCFPSLAPFSPSLLNAREQNGDETEVAEQAGRLNGLGVLHTWTDYNGGLGKCKWFDVEE